MTDTFKLPTKREMLVLIRKLEQEADKYGRGERDTHLLKIGGEISDALDALYAALATPSQWEREARELYGPSPTDAMQSAFIAGLDKAREHYNAYGEFPSLPGRLDLASDAFPLTDSPAAPSGEATTPATHGAPVITTDTGVVVSLERYDFLQKIEAAIDRERREHFPFRDDMTDAENSAWKFSIIMAEKHDALADELDASRATPTQHDAAHCVTDQDVALLREWIDETDWDDAGPAEGQRANAVQRLLDLVSRLKPTGRGAPTQEGK